MFFRREQDLLTLKHAHGQIQFLTSVASNHNLFLLCKDQKAVENGGAALATVPLCSLGRLRLKLSYAANSFRPP